YDNVPGIDFLFRAVVNSHLQLSGAKNGPNATESLDLVFLEQEFDAFHIGIDRCLLVRQHLLQIEFRFRHDDAKLLEFVSGLVEHLGGVKQSFRWNAPDIETGAAKGRFLFNYRNLQAKLGCLDGAYISARSASDHDNVISHSATLPCCSGRQDAPQGNLVRSFLEFRD